jgi:hypothetical protein
MVVRDLEKKIAAYRDTIHASAILSKVPDIKLYFIATGMKNCIACIQDYWTGLEEAKHSA